MIVSRTYREFTVDRVLDNTNGVNYWLQTLFGSVPYENLPLLQFTRDDNLLVVNTRIDEIQGNAIDFSYPLLVVKSVGGSVNEYKSTPSAWSGPVVVAIEFFTGYDTTEFPLDSDDYHDLFEDCFLEAFTSYASLSAFQSLGINFNNDVVVEREEIKQGGPGWRQKSSYQITFRVMSLQPRTGL